jgi:hypothetical protein
MHSRKRFAARSGHAAKLLLPPRGACTETESWQLDQDALHRQSCIYPVDADPMNSIPFGQIIEIPDVALNKKLIPANDYREPTALSKENFEAGSILVPRAYAKPGKLDEYERSRELRVRTLRAPEVQRP